MQNDECLVPPLFTSHLLLLKTMTMLSSKDGVKSRKVQRCALCGELINIGDLKDVRIGVDCGNMWTMHMHPECHAYEQTGAVDLDWYEDIMEPAFPRVVAMTHALARL